MNLVSRVGMQYRTLLVLLLLVLSLPLQAIGRPDTAVASGPITNPVFRILTRTPVGLVYVDAGTGDLYAVTARGVIAIDAQGQVRQVYTSVPSEYICGLAIDGTNHHMLLSTVIFDSSIMPSPAPLPLATSMARVIDAASGQILNSLTIFRGQTVCNPAGRSFVAIDPDNGHGFVSDYASGQSAMIDVGSGALLHRFQMDLPWVFPPIVNNALPWVVDSQRHRLVVSTVHRCTSSCSSWPHIITIDTNSGQLIRSTPSRSAPISVLALDDATGRVYFLPEALAPGDVFALDDSSGKIAAHVHVTRMYGDGNVTGNVTVDSSTHHVYLYIGGTALAGASGSGNGPAHLIVMNGRATRVLRRLRMPNPRHDYSAGATLVDAGTGRLFVLVGAHFLVLDPSTLRLLQTISLAPLFHGTYIGIDLDTMTHRLLAFGPSGIVALNEG
ncbi:MAG TPA: hypothetical protein VFB58_03390 [Chloroflexota bacterium]|nr:hypothetical protein [Chloroflexota bacterium]